MRSRATGPPLLLLPEIEAGRGGIQTLGRNMIEAFARLLPGSVSFVLNDACHTTDGSAGPRTGFEGRRAHFSVAVFRHVRATRPGLVVHFHRNLLPLAVPVAWASPGSRQWLLLHGIEAEPRLGLVERWALRRVGRVLAVSAHTADAFARAGGPRSVDVWTSSLPAGQRLPSLAARPERSGFDLLSVARLTARDAYKGIDDTIDAVARVRSAGHDVRLDVVGDGDDRARLTARAAAAGVADSVRFHGEVEPDDLERLYARCDAFVLPSRREGLGLVYLEAMAHARPVVAADAAGARFVVRPETGGRLVPPGDVEALARGIEEMLGDREATRRAGLAGRRAVEESFTFDAYVERTRALLRADGFAV